MLPIIFSLLLSLNAVGPQIVLTDTLRVGEEAEVYQNATTRSVFATVYFGTTGIGAKAVARHYKSKRLLQILSTNNRIKAVTFEVEQGGSIELICQKLSNVYCECPYQIMVNGVALPRPGKPDKIEGYDSE